MGRQAYMRLWECRRRFWFDILSRSRLASRIFLVHCCAVFSSNRCHSKLKTPVYDVRGGANFETFQSEGPFLTVASVFERL